MVLNAAVQMLREADELKEKILKFKSGTSMLQERSLWTTQQQLQKVYQKVLVLDLDYALDKKVEQDLWNVGFKQQIEALQAISRDRKNPLRSEGQAMLSWVLQSAAGFYLCLLHQICSTFKLDLPFRRRASLLGLVSGWGAAEAARLPAAAAARYITQHCLVHLGDLARYRHQLRVAHTFYRHAVVVSAHSGQPYNQLALVSWRGGRRLSALYWHARSLLVRAPFPPAPANLARTLAAAAAMPRESSALPVLPGVTVPTSQLPAVTEQPPGRLDAHSYITELVRAMNMIYNVEELDTAAALVKTLNSSLVALVATDSFEKMTLIKMACVLMWLVHSSTDGLDACNSALTSSETTAAGLATELAHGALLALLLPAYTMDGPPDRALPAIKVWLWWLISGEGRSPGGALPAALAHTLTALTDLTQNFDPAPYETVPLPEDEELHGFLPLEESFKGLKFAHHAAWDTYGGRVPDLGDSDQPASDISAPSLSSECDLEKKVRVHRILTLGRRVADKYPDLMTYSSSPPHFSSAPISEGSLSAALAPLSAGVVEGAPASHDDEADSDDEPAPRVISEADFREKVREKRVGILKPQGSLERAREERALATNSQEEPEAPESVAESKEDKDKKEARKPRVNIAMAAIMRKQEETSKQVKFITPPPTPEDQEAKDDKPKIIQPKPIKSLANIPIGRKTGGILSLKDKSAGYPHLVNNEPEPVKKVEKDEVKDAKQTPGPSQSSQTSFQQKRPEAAPASNWNPNIPPPMYNEPRMNFHKNYGIQNTGINYNPNYKPTSNLGIRLPVVNPKEIDVRTAALQKQNSRQELFQDGHKYHYQMSGDKKNFLNDLPPRFANQYRHWQTAQDNQFTDNKFKDDNFKPGGFPQQRGWSDPSYAAAPAAPTWWKPDAPAPPSFPPNYTPIHNYYSPIMNSNTNPYQNFNQLANQQKKPDNVITPPNYLQTNIQPPLQTLQNLVTSPNFNSSIGGFSSFPPPVSYDAAMYPQFNNVGYPLQMVDKTYQGKEQMNMSAISYRSNVMDAQLRNMNYGDAMHEPGKSTDHVSGTEGEGGNTYSLFSGAAEMPAWASTHTHPHQSLWCGPGPSPLERLLEQQKQMKQPPAPQ